MTVYREISRTNAKAQGLTQYHTGKPCRHGHTGPRFVHTGYCVECVLGRATRLGTDQYRQKLSLPNFGAGKEKTHKLFW